MWVVWISCQGMSELEGMVGSEGCSVVSRGGSALDGGGGRGSSEGLRGEGSFCSGVGAGVSGGGELRSEARYPQRLWKAVPRKLAMGRSCCGEGNDHNG